MPFPFGGVAQIFRDLVGGGGADATDFHMPVPAEIRSWGEKVEEITERIDIDTTGQTDKVLKVNTAGSAYELVDSVNVPDYAGNAGRSLTVNTAENDVEWTDASSVDSAEGVFTTSVTSADYTLDSTFNKMNWYRIGKIVHVSGLITITAGTGSSFFNLNLPLPSADLVDSGSTGYGLSVYYYDDSTAQASAVTATISEGATPILRVGEATSTEFRAGDFLRLCFTYRTT